MKALEGKNRVVIDQLTLGKKSNSEQVLSLPLGLAIALLEDRNGVIDLGLDVSGDIDSPDFSSAPLSQCYWQYYKAVLPFRYLRTGCSDDELDNVEFGFEAFAQCGRSKKLNTLAKALKRPGLGLISVPSTPYLMLVASATSVKHYTFNKKRLC